MVDLTKVDEVDPRAVLQPDAHVVRLDVPTIRTFSHFTGELQLERQKEKRGNTCVGSRARACP